MISGFGSNSSSATDFSQYYDPSSYWQSSTTGYGSVASTAWPGYDQTASSQTDYSAYYQQQAAAHVQHQNVMVQQQSHGSGVSGTSSTHHTYNAEDDDLALVGTFRYYSLNTFLEYSNILILFRSQSNVGCGQIKQRNARTRS